MNDDTTNASASRPARRLPSCRGVRGLRASACRLALGLCASMPAVAQARLAPRFAAEERVPPVERVLTLAREDNRVQEHLRTLTKTIGARLTGSHKFELAAEWSRDQFQAWGLSAHLETWGEFPVGFDRGPSRGAIVAPGSVDLEFITPAWSAGTSGPVRGPALLEPASDEELAAMKERAHGAWIVRGENRADLKTRNKLREALKALGAAGFVSSGPENGALTMNGNYRVDIEKLSKVAEIRLRHDQHVDLVARLKSGEPVELEFDIDNRITPGPIACVNVVGELRGIVAPDECVIVGAHLDSWDGAEGAQDNGTGAATTLEAARLLAAAHVHPRRTIRFVLFGGEEEGLLGSVAYVKAHKDALANVSAVLIHDGGANHVAGIRPTYAMRADFERVFARLVALDPARPFRVHESPGLVNSGDSDHAPFLRAGVPAFFWDQDDAGYERVHHTQFDTFETVDPEEQKYSACAIAVGAYGLADLDHRLDRTDMKPVEPRRMGVRLERTRVAHVLEDGRAAAAGWKDGDVVLSVDGRRVTSQAEITEELQQGGPKKTVRLQRGDQTLDTVLDYTSDPDEPERAAREERRAAFVSSHSR
jgi:hypothetical protein